jgi:hypothetical protein
MSSTKQSQRLAKLWGTPTHISLYKGRELKTIYLFC